MILVLIENTCVQPETQRYSNASQDILIHATFHPELFNKATSQVNHIYCTKNNMKKQERIYFTVCMQIGI